MDKVTQSEVEAVVTKTLEKMGIAKTSSPDNVLAEIEQSDLSESTKKALAAMLTKAETMDKSIRRNSVVATSPGPASVEIDQLAKELVQKSGKPMDLATARVEIRKMHPDLARQEQEEYRRF